MRRQGRERLPVSQAREPYDSEEAAPDPPAHASHCARHALYYRASRCPVCADPSLEPRQKLAGGREPIALAERRAKAEALYAAGWNLTRISKALEISRTTALVYVREGRRRARIP